MYRVIGYRAMKLERFLFLFLFSPHICIVVRNKGIFIAFSGKHEQLHCMKSVQLADVGTATYIDYVPAPRSFIQTRKIRVTTTDVFSASNNGWTDIQLRGCRGTRIQKNFKTRRSAMWEKLFGLVWFDTAPEPVVVNAFYAGTKCFQKVPELWSLTYTLTKKYYQTIKAFQKHFIVVKSTCLSQFTTTGSGTIGGYGTFSH